MASQPAILDTWAAEQDRLKGFLKEHDDFEWSLDAKEESKALKYVGGIDVSFFGEASNMAIAALSVVAFPSFKLVYEAYEVVTLKTPYIPGFLAFREVEPTSQLLAKLKASKPELYPQVLLIDGNGILHQRGFGLASHLGVVADIPTVGVAKTFFNVDGLEKSAVMERAKKELTRGGDHFPLTGKSGRIWGAALLSTSQNSNPIFVSVGHRISLKTALALVQRACIYRVPEPIRLADLGSRQEVRHYQQMLAVPSEGGGAASAAIGRDRSRSPAAGSASERHERGRSLSSRSRSRS